MKPSGPGLLFFATGEAIPLRGLEGVPGLPGAQKTKAQDQMASQENSIKHLEKS